MSTALVPLSVTSEALPESTRFDELRLAVLNGVTSKNSRRNYALAFNELAAFCTERQHPLSRNLLLAFREAMLERKLRASTIKVKLYAAQRLVGEARRAGIISGEQAAQMTDVPNIP